jgi:DNA-binding response OmpR family regulator
MGSLLLVRNDLQEALDLSRELRRFGHSVVIESEFRAALWAIEQQELDIVICDDVLPGGVGVDLVNAARMQIGRPLLPAVLLLSVPPALNDRIVAMDNVNVLVEPFSGEQLVESVARFRIPLPGDERRKRNVTVPGYHRRKNDATKAHRKGRSRSVR